MRARCKQLHVHCIAAGAAAVGWSRSLTHDACLGCRDGLVVGDAVLRDS
jgi:hypothetical protein